MPKIISHIYHSINFTNKKSYLHKAQRKNRFHSLLLLLLLLSFGAGNLAIRAAAKQDKDIQEGIAEEILRFHVIANSDSAEDQRLKLLVKDRLVGYLAPMLTDCMDLAEVREVVHEKLPDLIALANATIQMQGYDYRATASLEDCYFPLKVYGAYTFPPGTYHALRIKLGNAEGRNWWCVMFPPLCFVDETYSIVDEESGEKLSKLLTEEEYETLINRKTPVKVRLKLLESLKKLFEGKDKTA
jgi:stage II sporulation protein R